MSGVGGTEEALSRRRIILASLFVAVTVVGVWKFVDYRTQPPAPPPTASEPASGR